MSLIDRQDDTSSKIVIVVPGAPQGKGRPRFRIIRSKDGASFGSAYTPAPTRSYEAIIRDLAQKAMVGRPAMDGAIVVDLLANMPIPGSWSKSKKIAAATGAILPTTKPDWENIAKVLDALNGVVWVDDKQVIDGRVRKRYSDSPSLRIEVSLATAENLR